MTPQGFALTRHTVFFSNSFRTEASGRFVRASDGGTEIGLRLGMSRAPAIFTTCWLGFCLVFAVVMLAIAVVGWLGGPPFRTQDGAGPLVVLALPLGMGAFGVALVALGRWLSRNEGPFLVRFPGETLEAQEVRPTPRA